MIVVKIYDIKASFSDRWHSEARDVEIALNSYFPEDEVSADTAFRTGSDGTVGIDALAWDSVKHLEGMVLIENKPVDPPEEIDGVVY